ncbi:uncharacterized protein LOC130053871 [Ostrea edulis]|uniref:uncharacterized protein LOC130053871 n=1 Tax=Ostrea edulis TaxID=37623 RepID=UPI0024AF4DDE|nr:uncharacterized protein LOC130053871 [Ostrea edulis]
MHSYEETPFDKHTAIEKHGGEDEPPASQSVNNKCTEICQGDFKGKSCAKIVLVTVTHSAFPDRRFRTYAILDDQSNRTLAQKDLFDAFDIVGERQDYTLSSCAGNTLMSGRRSAGFTVESLDGTYRVDLPTLIECTEIPNDRSEIPTCDIAMLHEHLRPIAHELPPTEPESRISLLIGRDVPEAHHVLDQIIGPYSKPYAQKLRLGWVVIGDVCLQGRHVPDRVCARKTHVLQEGRGSIFRPCTSKLEVSDDYGLSEPLKEIPFRTREDRFASTVFERTKHDDKIGLSCEDRTFMEIMDKELHKDIDGSWCAPLLFKPSRERLPNNRKMALHRAMSLEKGLKKDSTKCEHFIAFMEKLLICKHAKIAPDLVEGEEVWYIPVFGVYHPKKRDQIRCVFDSSAKFEGVSLNDVMLSGPDLVNNLITVLMRFKKEPVAVMADIQQMFYCFTVREDHRNFFLGFFGIVTTT